MFAKGFVEERVASKVFKQYVFQSIADGFSAESTSRQNKDASRGKPVSGAGIGFVPTFKCGLTSDDNLASLSLTFKGNLTSMAHIIVV